MNLAKREIRLAVLDPSEHFEDQPVCNLRIFSLDDAPDYEALSYAWDDPKVARPIQLQGIQLPVTTNLESALRHLRHRPTKRVLWIDAICINQAFKKEPSYQVELMKFMYCDTSVVRVWLGEEPLLDQRSS